MKEEFVALTKALDGLFDKPIADLPKGLRQRVERAFPAPWHCLDQEQRRRVAKQWDYQNDPELEDEREEWFNLYGREVAIKREIRELELLPDAPASERESKLRQLKKLRTDLDGVRREIRELHASDGETATGAVRSKDIDRNFVIAMFSVRPTPTENKAYWDDKLGRPPDWLRSARTFVGRRGVSSRWDALLVAHALLQKGDMTIRNLDHVIHGYFPDLLVQWREETEDVR